MSWLVRHEDRMRIGGHQLAHAACGKFQDIGTATVDLEIHIHIEDPLPIWQESRPAESGQLPGGTVDRNTDSSRPGAGDDSPFLIPGCGPLSIQIADGEWRASTSGDLFHSPAGPKADGF